MHILARRVLPWFLLACTFFAFAPCHAQRDEVDETMRLITKLKDPKPAIRLAAVQKLENFLDDERVLSPLITALADTDPATRKTAAMHLGRIGDPRAVDGLLKLLADGNKNIRKTAAESLGYIGDAKALPALAKLRDTDADAEVRLEAVNALWRIGGPDAIDPLLRASKDADDAVARDAIEGLGFLTEDNAVAPLYALASNPEEANSDTALASLGYLGDERAAELILTRWKVAPTTITFVDYFVLANVGDPRAVEPIMAWLKKDTWQTNMAVDALGRLGDARAVDALCEVMSNKKNDVSLRKSAAEALGMIGDAKAVPALITALSDVGVDEWTSPRLAAVVALGRIGDARAVDALLPLATAKDKDLEVRYRILTALAAMGSPKATSVLGTAAQSDDYQLAGIGLSGLAKIPEARAVKAAVKVISEHDCFFMRGDLEIENVAATLVANPAMTLDDVNAVLQQDENNSAQRPAAQFMSRSTDPRALGMLVAWVAEDGGILEDIELANLLRPLGAKGVDALLAALTDEETYFKWNIIRALGLLGDARAVPALKKFLLEEDGGRQMERGDALVALARLGVTDVVPTMIEEAKTGESRSQLLAALGMLKDPRALEVLLAALRETKGDEAYRIRAAAARGLEQLGDARATEPLLAALGDRDTSVRIGAAQALAQLPPDPRSIEPLLAMLSYARSAGGWDLRFAAVPALARLQDPRIFPALTMALRNGTTGNNEPTQRIIAKVLGESGNSHAVLPVMHCLRAQSEDAVCRAICCEALGKLKDPRAVLSLLRCLRDDAPTVRTAAATALTAITGQDLGQDHARWTAWWLETHK